MKTFAQFCAEAYDKDVMGSSQIRRTGEGGRIGPERKKTAPERRRMKAVGGGKMVPAKDYKPRADIGQQRPSSEQQPEKERGSAEVKQSYADKVKAERRKAAQARIAAKKSGETATVAKPKAKEKAKEIAKARTQLLSKKKTQTVSPTYKPQKASGKTEAERKATTKKGEKALRDLRLQNLGKKSEKELKHPITAKEIARRKKEGQ